MTTENRIIRRAILPADGEAINQVFEAARGIMVRSGNTHQWQNGYPTLENVRMDIEREGAFVIVDNGLVVGYFAYLPSPEPTYAKIYDGEWVDNNLPYHVVHRIASLPDTHGVFASIMDFCFARDHTIRIDTHRDNLIMQHNILKHGFTYCGIILLLNGDERLAYQKVKSEE
jgi:hypothetical protein